MKKINRKDFSTTLDEDVVRKIKLKVINSNKFTAMNELIEFLVNNFIDHIDDDGNKINLKSSRKPRGNKNEKN